MLLRRRDGHHQLRRGKDDVLHVTNRQLRDRQRLLRRHLRCRLDLPMTMTSLHLTKGISTMREHVFAGFTVLLLGGLGGSVAFDAACASTVNHVDAGPTCNADSGDPAGCACDPSAYKTSD